MSKITSFLNNWVSENINFDAYVSEDGNDERPARYATQLLAEAEERGFTRNEIEAEIGTSLKDYIAERMDEATDNHRDEQD